MAGYSSWPSPKNGSKCTYKWVGRPLFWSLKYGQSSQPDAGTVNKVALPVNTNARTELEALRTRLGPETAQVT